MRALIEAVVGWVNAVAGAGWFMRAKVDQPGVTRPWLSTGLFKFGVTSANIL
jgi:hypothetical protein